MIYKMYNKVIIFLVLCGGLSTSNAMQQDTPVPTSSLLTSAAIDSLSHGKHMPMAQVPSTAGRKLGIKLLKTVTTPFVKAGSYLKETAEEHPYWTAGIVGGTVALLYYLSSRPSDADAAAAAGRIKEHQRKNHTKVQVAAQAAHASLQGRLRQATTAIKIARKQALNQGTAIGELSAAAGDVDQAAGAYSTQQSGFAKQNHDTLVDLQAKVQDGHEAVGRAEQDSKVNAALIELADQIFNDLSRQHVDQQVLSAAFVDAMQAQGAELDQIIELLEALVAQGQSEQAGPSGSFYDQ